jgi:WD40 repeat protein
MQLRERDGFALTGSFDTTVRLWQIGIGQCQRIFSGHTSTVYCLDSVGNGLVSGSRDCTLRVWSIHDGRCLSVLAHGSPVRAVRIGPGLTPLVASGTEGGEITLWDTDAAAAVDRFPAHRGRITALDFSERFIVSCGLDGYARVWRSDTHALLRQLKHNTPVLCLAVRTCCKAGRVLRAHGTGRADVWRVCVRHWYGGWTGAHVELAQRAVRANNPGRGL